MKPDINEVWAFCRYLHWAEQYDQEDGYSYWLQDNQGTIVKARKGLTDMDELEGRTTRIECGKCTNGAELIAKKFGGYVAGYSMGEEFRKTFVGYDCGGHDFAVLGDYIVDWWGWTYECSLTFPILRYRKAVEMGKFLPRQYWRVFPGYDFRTDPCRPAVLRLSNTRDNQPPCCHGKAMQYSTQRIEEGTTVVQFVCPACRKRYER